MVTTHQRPVVKLASGEAAARARRTHLLLSDCDGVLTDGTVTYTARGEESKRFSLRDGMGVERLRADGVESAILTRERSAVVAARAEKLGIRLFQGVLDKGGMLDSVLAELGVTADATAYIGDDVNDLAVIDTLDRVGLTAAPADAEPQVLSAVHFVCVRPGGAGAFREFAEWILSHRHRLGSESSNDPEQEVP